MDLKAEVLAKMNMKSEAEVLKWLRAKADFDLYDLTTLTDQYQYQICIGTIASVNWSMLSLLQEPIPPGDVLEWLRASDEYKHVICIDHHDCVKWEELRLLLSELEIN